MRFHSFKEMIGHWAETTPDAPALRVEERGKGEPGVVTYAQLREKIAEKVSSFPGPGACVAFLLEDDGARWVPDILAAVEAGAQVVLLDANLPVEALRDQLAYTDADTLRGPEDLVEELKPQLPGPHVADGAGKLLFFTSGTTESSKAVVLTQESLCASAWNGSALLPLDPQDALLCVLPLNHVFGFVCGFLWAIQCGASVALGRGLRHYLDDCAFFKPTAVSLVPLQLSFLLKNDCLNPELKLVLIGAGDCPMEYLVAAHRHGLRVSYGYGLTETSSGVALSVGGDVMAMDVCPDFTVTLAEDGEVLIQGPTAMMQGYYKRPEDTAAVLIDGVFHTGDLGAMDAQGRLYLTGRKKEMLVFSDGTKIFLPEYEREIAGAIGARELAVVKREDGPVLVLVGDEVEKSAVAQALRPLMATKPRGQQLRDIVLRAEPLPRTATGKVKRWEIEKGVGTL